MIREVNLRVVSDNVRVFDGEIALPQDIYVGAIEYYVIRPEGVELTVPASALIRVDRAVLEGLGAKIVPNLQAIDFGVLAYIESGDIRVV